MTDQHFSTTFAVDRTPETVFDAVRDVRGWWSRTLTGRSEKPGDVFTYEVPGIHRATIEVTEVIPCERVVWRVLDVRFTHVGLTPAFECFDACRKGWSFYIGTSLHDLIATGTGHPDEDPQALALANENVAATPH